MADSAVNALNSLLRGSSIEDDAEALKLANAAIKAAKSAGGTDLLTAQHTKVVALLRLDRYDDALRAIAEAGTALEKQCGFEKAYALYKTGHLVEAEETCRQSSGDGPARALSHVAAQIAYRAEKFDEAAKHYGKLVKHRDGARAGEGHDIRVNALATKAQLELSGQADGLGEKERQPQREDLEAFETAYNAACGCVGRGDLSKASVLLKRAKDLCEASEDLSDEEKQTELLPILIQQVYVLTRLGKSEDALTLQKSLSGVEISDGAIKAVAQNNGLLIQAGDNPYLAERLAKSISLPDGNARLFDFQASVLERNKRTIELQCQKFKGTEVSTGKALLKAFESGAGTRTSSSAVTLGVINAAAKSEMQSGKDALRRILPLLDTRPDDVGLLLTIIQLYIQTKNPGPAVSLLEAFFKRLETATAPNFADVRFAPGLVALAVALYKLHGRHAAVRTELNKAAAHWETRSVNQGPAAPSSLLRGAGTELLHSTNSSDLAVAGAAFEQVLEHNETDRTATAGKVASFALSDYEKVEPHLNSLTPVDQLIKGIDVAALLEKGVATLPQQATSAIAASKKRAAAADAEAPAKKKRRRNKLPKDYDPNKKVDPERWLPLRDRSSYRPKGKKGKKRAAEATQGGVVKEEETLELAGGAGSVKVEKAPQGGGGAAKKKKKGKK